MNLKVGNRIWLPCEVKSGPFSNERLARIQLPSEPWIGFVDVRALKEPIEKGSTCVLAQIIAVEQDSVTALVQGHSFNTRQVHTPAAEVYPVVSVSS
jgi:hypothetical protein